MSTLKIKDGNALGEFLKLVAEESVNNAIKNLQKKKDEAIIVEKDNMFANPPPVQQPEQKPAQQSISTETPNTITLDTIVQKLNIIRSGKSLKKDDLVQGELSDYFNKLSDPEKKSLYAFLKSIGAVMGGAVDGENLPTPHDASTSSPEATQEPKEPPQQSVKPQNQVSVEHPEQQVAIKTKLPAEENDDAPIRVKMSNEAMRRNVKKLIK